LATQSPPNIPQVSWNPRTDGTCRETALTVGFGGSKALLMAKETKPSPTLKALRALARERLGKGYARMTKEALLAALRKRAPQALRALLAKLATVPKTKGPRQPPKGSAVRANEVHGTQPPKRAPRAVAAMTGKGPLETEAGKGSPPPAVALLPTSKEPHEVRESAPKSPPPASHVGAAPAAGARRPSRRRGEGHRAPVTEGFFLRRQRGEPDPAPAQAERALAAVGLPEHYPEPRAVLLPRDPRTLYFFWDPGARGAAGGRESAVLRLSQDEALLREVDLPSEARGHYLHGLTPGQRYRVEVVGGVERRPLAPPSDWVALPNDAPSAEVALERLKVPLDAPLPKQAPPPPPPPQWTPAAPLAQGEPLLAQEDLTPTPTFLGSSEHAARRRSVHGPRGAPGGAPRSHGGNRSGIGRG
jgi:hypothetical protein